MPSSVKYLGRTAEETKDVGRRLGRLLKMGDVILFIGNLGAGKTTFIQGMIRSFGIKEEALSPTFVIAQTLAGTTPVHHLDFYRLTPREIVAFGIEDYLTGKGEIEPGVVLIEWADRCKEIWPRERVEVRIKIKPRSTSRDIVIRGHGPRGQAVVKNLARRS